MSKKNISIVLSLVLIVFSFYYTNNIIKISKKNDPIMIELMNYYNEYDDIKQEAIIENGNIIPGINGENIDIDKSYSNMKRKGEFDEKLLVFKETNPKEELNNNYDKYIVSGNKTKSNISIIFIIDNFSNIKEIISILKQRNINATFFIKSELFEKKEAVIKQIINLGNDVELLSSTYKTFEINNINSILKIISNDKLSYCITKGKNNELLSNCKKSKLHTIIPTLVVEKHLYSNIKKNLENGSIILIEDNKNNIKELLSTLNYITKKGEKIILLKEMLKE